MDKPTKAECCTDHESESGCRNHYFDGKRLTTDSFRVEQNYFLERRHLLNRAIHGWGVVYGLAVSGKPGRLTIGPGLALDQCGRELLQIGTRPVRIEDLIVVDERGAPTGRERAFSSASSERPCWLLSVHYAEQSTGRMTVEDSCNCKHEEWDRICETVRYTLRPIDCDDCCAETECELTCDCATEPCCHDRKDDYGAHQRHGRGGCRCLCEHLTSLQPDAGNCSLCEVDDPCGRVRVDLENGVPIACITLARDERNYWTCVKVDECGPRRLVKRNDLLFDLIRGCDLTRISEIGWRDWHRREEPVPFDDFSDALGPDGHHEDAYVARDFWVKFSRPVRTETLQPDCFVMTAMSGEREGGWWQVLRVPIVRLEIHTGPNDPPGHASGAAFAFDGAWVEDGVRGRRSLFLGSETYIEIEVRGDFIVDCNGQTVDANAAGLSPSPTGNGTPGGTFVSGFRVAARGKDTYAADRVKGASS